jgi:hypothetical protein
MIHDEYNNTRVEWHQLILFLSGNRTIFTRTFFIFAKQVPKLEISQITAEKKVD